MPVHRPCARAQVAALALACIALLIPARAGAQSAGPSVAPRAGSSPGTNRKKSPPRPAPPPGLGAHASLLEGTWEFRSLSRTGGVTMTPPAASGVIVIDRGVVLAASYLQATADRKVGNVWEGRMVLGDGTYQVIPERGFRYDSAAEEPVVPVVPPKTAGSLEKLADGGLRMLREDGGSVTFEPGGRRVQRDADGTTIIHERTSLVPRVPEDLPGRTP